MILSRDRILATHVGSLPRNEELSEMLIDREEGKPLSDEQLAQEMDRAVRHVIAKQAEAGIDIGNDGEQQRVDFKTYVPRRISGFAGESKRRRGRDFEEFPALVDDLARRFPKRSRMQNAPEAQAELHYLDSSALTQEIDRFQKNAIAAGAFAESFMTAPSPGIISTTMLNAYYDSQQSYLTALAREMRNEYLAHCKGHFVGLRLIAECAGHAAATGLDRLHVQSGNQAKRFLCRRHCAEALLMAMAVQQRLRRDRPLPSEELR